MKFSDTIKKTEIEYRRSLNQRLKYGCVIFDTPVGLNENAFITEINMNRECTVLDGFGNDGLIHVDHLDIYDLAVIMDEIEK